jgi:hypothetical protein
MMTEIFLAEKDGLPLLSFLNKVYLNNNGDFLKKFDRPNVVTFKTSIADHFALLVAS